MANSEEYFLDGDRFMDCDETTSDEDWNFGTQPLPEEDWEHGTQPLAYVSTLELDVPENAECVPATPENY